MRAIDADALIEFIENRYDITWKCDYEGGIKDACTDILEKISKMPTIEPERKKGKWIKGVGENGITTSEFCSCCRYENKHWCDWNFCPNCGADMREETDAD